MMKRTYWHWYCAVLLTVYLAMLPSGFGETSVLDPAFGSEGISIIGIDSDTGLFADRSTSMLIQTDGKIVIAGHSSNGIHSDIAIARWNANGTMDEGFGVGGKVTTDLGSNLERAHGVAQGPDGKIVVTGTSTIGLDTYLAVARYHSNGSIDTSFSDDGTTTLAVLGNTFVSGVAVQQDGKVLLAGHTGNNEQYTFLLRLKENGTLDDEAQFPFGGFDNPIVSLSNGDDVVTGMILQPDGRILVIGAARESGGFANDFVVARFSSTGRLDPSFSNDGIATADFNGDSDMPVAVALQTDGKIVVAGTSQGGGNNIKLARFTAAGELDESFDGDGLLEASVGGPPENGIATSLAVQGDGKILVGGNMNNDFLLLRLNSDGSTDTSVSPAGYITTDFGGGLDGATALSVQLDGKIVLGGSIQVSTGLNNTDFGLTRFHPDGTTDMDFGITGIASVGFGSSNDRGNAIAALENGRLLVAGSTAGDFLLTKVDATGLPDADFGNSGSAIVDFVGLEDAANAIAIQADGKILVAGTCATTRAGINDHEFAVARFDPDGTLDTSFSEGGKLRTAFAYGASASDIALQADGKIVVTGTAENGIRVVRYEADGSLDSEFGAGGKVALAEGIGTTAAAMALQNDGKMVITGSVAFDDDDGTDVVTYRLHPDGSQDASFGINGRQITDFSGTVDGPRALVIDPLGKIVIAGFAGGKHGESSAFALIRLLPDGTLDLGFGGDGTVTTSFGGVSEARGVVILPNGKILAVGGALQGSGEWNLAAARYHSDGNPDLSFAGSGRVSKVVSGYYDSAHALVLTSDGRAVAAGSSMNAGALDIMLAAFLPEEPSPLSLADWRQLHFGGSENSGTGADDMDADGDGLVNLLEWFLGLDPNSPEAPPMVVGREGSALAFTYTRSKAAVLEGAQFGFEASEDLKGGAWFRPNVTEEIVAEHGDIQHIKARVFVNSSKYSDHFLRLVVSPP